MRQHQELALKQKMIVTPQLKQSLDILQLTNLELAQYLQQKMLENPALESIEEEEETEQEDEEEDEVSPELGEEWLEYFGPDSGNDEEYYRPSDDTAYVSDIIEDTISYPSSFRDDLISQLHFKVSSPEKMGLLALLVANLDDDGYFRKDINEMAKDFGIPVDDIEKGLRLIQSLDPPGIAARNLKECLLIQVKRLGIPNEVVIALISNYLEELGRGKYNKIIEEMKISKEELREALEEIKKLNPIPMSGSSATEQGSYITPDVIVREIDGECYVMINDNSVPRFRINPFYRRILKEKREEGGDKKAYEYVKDRINAAAWLLRCVEQRRNTIYQVTKTICDHQKDFFKKGVEALRPLNLVDIADELGIHESTVSRVTSKSYIQTPRGVYPFRFFFPTELSSSDGTGVSSTSVKKLIQDIIQSEDPKHPLSDEKIAQRLKEQGIGIARRTVAKYRNEMKILSARQRKGI